MSSDQLIGSNFQAFILVPLPTSASISYSFSRPPAVWNLEVSSGLDNLLGGIERTFLLHFAIFEIFSARSIQDKMSSNRKANHR
jgi:hypothetical protein